MTNTFFVQLIDAMTNLSTINVTTIDASKKTFENLLKHVRKEHGYNFEKEMAANGINSSITFRTWLNDEATISDLRKFEQGRKVVAKIMKSREKYELENA